MDSVNTRNILLGIGSLAALFALLYGVYSLSNQTTEPGKQYKEAMTIKASDRTTWSPDKKILLVEYSDLQCPACKNFHNVLKPYSQAGTPQNKLAQKITLVYRHFPLEQTHEWARQAAAAAEAAHIQGKFFPMADLLFENQSSWEKLKDPTDTFLGFAKDLKLDLGKFKADMKSEAVQKLIDEDIKSGNNVGVNATPTFYLNGRKIEITSIAQFQELLTEATK
jgi:protein-disulfide isomerase